MGRHAMSPHVPSAGQRQVNGSCRRTTRRGRESARLAAGFSNMSNTARPIQLPEDLQAFAEERVRAGESASVDEVVRGALQEKKLAVLQRALDEGIAELDAGLGVE